MKDDNSKRVPVYLSMAELKMLHADFKPEEWTDTPLAQKLQERLLAEIERNEE